MKRNNRLIQPIGSERYSLCLDSTMLAEDIAFLKKNNIKSITLIERSGGYILDNIDFLQSIPDLKEIYMAGCPCINNYNGLSYVKDLSVLVFSPQNNVKVDLSGLKSLNFLSFQYSNNIMGLKALSNITKLWVWGGNEDFFSPNVFSVYKNLSTLEINQSKLQDLYFVECCPLNTLIFNQVSSNFTLAGLSKLSRTLKVLKFIATKHVRDISQLSSLVNLSSLILSNSFALDNCKIIANLKKIESLTLIGSSFFKDGDLSSISTIVNNLKYNNIAKKRHYFY